MSSRFSCVFALVAAAALCGCATQPASQQPAAYRPAANRTGSLIPVPASDVTKPGFGPSQSVSQDQLTQTGRLDVASALKTLVPQAH